MTSLKARFSQGASKSSITLWVSRVIFSGIQIVTTWSISALLPVFFPGLFRRFTRRSQGPPYVAELDGLEERRIHVLRQEHRKNRAWDYSLKNRLWHRLYHLPRFRLAVRTADRTVCATREIWNYVQLEYGLSSESVIYMPHAVDTRVSSASVNILQSLRQDCFMWVPGCRNVG